MGTMGDIVNLRRARKAKARADKARRAEENRAKHGRTKAERLRDDRQTAGQNKDLDGKRLD